MLCDGFFHLNDALFTLFPSISAIKWQFSLLVARFFRTNGLLTIWRAMRNAVTPVKNVGDWFEQRERQNQMLYNAKIFTAIGVRRSLRTNIFRRGYQSILNLRCAGKRVMMESALQQTLSLWIFVSGGETDSRFPVPDGGRRRLLYENMLQSTDQS